MDVPLAGAVPVAGPMVAPGAAATSVPAAGAGGLVARAATGTALAPALPTVVSPGEGRVPPLLRFRSDAGEVKLLGLRVSWNGCWMGFGGWGAGVAGNGAGNVAVTPTPEIAEMGTGGAFGTEPEATLKFGEMLCELTNGTDAGTAPSVCGWLMQRP